MQPEHHTAINWFEIPSTDFERAVGFYETIFAITLQRMTISAGTETPTPMAIFPSKGEGTSGAVVYMHDHRPGTTGPLIYLNANPDLSVVLNRVEKAGGTILVPKTEIPNNFGQMAIFLDSEGNHMALHSMG